MQATWSFAELSDTPLAAAKDTKIDDQPKNTASPFLKLLLELRNQIYKMIFQATPTKTCSMSPEAAPITQVCHQIRQECHSMWYAQQTFTVCNADCLERFLESRPTNLNVGKLIPKLAIEWLTNIGSNPTKSEREVKRYVPVIIDLLRSHQFGANVEFHVRAFGNGAADDGGLRDILIETELLIALCTARAQDRSARMFSRAQKRGLKKKFFSKHFAAEEEEYRRIAGEA